jgi:hypothetical protein
MNRIYQGKVTAVEIHDGKDQWKKLDAGEAALWQHHQLFQDDVNYLLAAFAALVPTSCEDDIWKDYQAAIERSWESYTGRQGTWDPKPCLPDSEASAWRGLTN